MPAGNRNFKFYMRAQAKLQGKEQTMKMPENINKTRKRRSKHLLRFLPLIAPFMLATASAPMSATAPGITKTHVVPVTIAYTGFEHSIHEMYDGMGLESTGLSFNVFEEALTGYLNLKSNNKLSEKPVLTIIDMEKSSKEKRLWVIDLQQKDVLFYTYVSHGKKSGDEYAKKFSNMVDSNMSSPGFYVANETYYGKHGLSLKLDGLDAGFNTNARERAIVMHGAEYASESTIKALGFLGRSEGCPAVPDELHEDIINSIKGNTAIYVHAPVKNYSSAYLNQDSAVQTFTDSGGII